MERTKSCNSQAIVGWLISFFALSLCIRLALVYALGATNFAQQSAHHEHESIAKNLALGNGFRFNFFGPDIERPNLTSQQAPLVPGVLAACYWSFGIETKSALMAMLLIQILISSATVVLLSLFAERTIHCGKIAGFLASFYPSLAISGLHVQALVWNLFWLSALLCAYSFLREDDRFRNIAFFCCASAGALHTDPILGAVIAGLLALLCFDKGISGQTIRTVFLTALLIAVSIAPWTYRNYVVHGRWMLIKNSFWYVLWQGNNAISQGTDKLLVPEAQTKSLESLWNPRAAQISASDVRKSSLSVNEALTSQEIHAMFSLDTECERMDWFRAKLLTELSAKPTHYLRMCILRLSYWFWFDATNPRSFLPSYRASYLALACMALIGFALLRKRLGDLSPAILAGIVLCMVHTLIITSARFRIPFELLLMLPASYAIGVVIQKMKAAVHRVVVRSANPLTPIRQS